MSQSIITHMKTSFNRLKPNKPKRPKCLCALLSYNGSDILEDVIDYMLSNHHDIIVWDHGSDDKTSEVLDNYKSKLVERKYIPRSFDFDNLYPLMSRNLIDNYINHYDWISWPDEDEILEGPNRRKSYYEYVCDVYTSKYNYIQFNNYNFWFTEEDDNRILSPVKRIRRYSIFPDCAPRIRGWRASVTNIREFNHNALKGKKYPLCFNLRHYPMRTYDQAIRRIHKDRAGIQRGDSNYHYENMKRNIVKLRLMPDQLHRDDGVSELNPSMIFNWREVYGHPPSQQR